VRIVDIRTHVLLDPGLDVGATSSAQDTIVVEIETDEGRLGSARLTPRGSPAPASTPRGRTRWTGAAAF
jgi:hypothetical protein